MLNCNIHQLRGARIGERPTPRHFRRHWYRNKRAQKSQLDGNIARWLVGNISRARAASRHGWLDWRRLMWRLRFAWRQSHPPAIAERLVHNKGAGPQWGIGCLGRIGWPPIVRPECLWAPIAIVRASRARQRPLGELASQPLQQHGPGVFAHNLEPKTAFARIVMQAIRAHLICSGLGHPSSPRYEPSTLVLGRLPSPHAHTKRALATSARATPARLVPLCIVLVCVCELE